MRARNLCARDSCDGWPSASRVRHRALRNAQKTANMGQLVENLKRVKSLRFNNPVFSPAKDYVVVEGSLAIVLETQQGAAEHEQSSHQAA